MINKQLHAKRELEILAKTTPDSILIPFTKEIVALCEAFYKSEQIGGSASDTTSIISDTVKKLMMFETLTPITGEDNEWEDLHVSYNDEPMFQNNRDSRIFKVGKDGKAYFSEAIVFNGNILGRFVGNDVDDKYRCRYTNGIVTHNEKTIISTQYIKEFPFIPKTFYIDVIDYRWKDREGKIPDENEKYPWRTHTIKEEEQLDKVFEYYNQYDCIYEKYVCIGE